MLQSATSEIGTSFAPKLFTDAPIYAGGLRNPETFVDYQPGVVNGAGAEGGISGGASPFQGDFDRWGQRTNPESGGVAFNGLPTIEQLGEFKIINNTFAAEYGRTGGGIESFVTTFGRQSVPWHRFRLPHLERAQCQLLGQQCQLGTSKAQVLMATSMAPPWADRSGFRSSTTQTRTRRSSSSPTVASAARTLRLVF